MGGSNNEDDQEVTFATPWLDVQNKTWSVMDDAPKREPKRKKGEAPVKKIISGTGIEEQKFVDVSQNEKILEALNSANTENLEEEEEQIRQRRLQEEADAEKYRLEHRQNVLRERFEQEQKEKAERERLEAEEAERLAKEQEEKKKNGFLFKFKANLERKKEQKSLAKEEAEALKEQEKKEKKESQSEKPVKEKPKKEVKAKPEKARPQSVDKTDYKYIATHDPITGLMNKVALEEATPPYKSTGILYMFIPDFDKIRVQGEEAEHAVLKQLSNLVEGNLGDYVYHLGNGVFVALLKNEMLDELDLLARGFKGSLGGVNYKMVTGKSHWEGTLGDALELAKQGAISKRNEKKASEGKKEKEVGKTLDYDALLTKDQRNLKETVRENHSAVDRDKTKNIVGQIKARHSEVIAIMMADKNFDKLFIIRDVRMFLSIVDDMDFQMDYSYLYVLYEGGPQYFGNDEYLSKITTLFDAISEGIRTGQVKTTKDVQKIKDINIFKEIYFG